MFFFFFIQKRETFLYKLIGTGKAGKPFVDVVSSEYGKLIARVSWMAVKNFLYVLWCVIGFERWREESEKEKEERKRERERIHR